MVAFVAPFYVCVFKERGENCIDAKIFGYCTKTPLQPPMCVAEEQMSGLALSLDMVFAFGLTIDQIQKQPQLDQTPSLAHHHSGKVVVLPSY